MYVHVALLRRRYCHLTNLDLLQSASSAPSKDQQTTRNLNGPSNPIPPPANPPQFNTPNFDENPLPPSFRVEEQQSVNGAPQFQQTHNGVPQYNSKPVSNLGNAQPPIKNSGALPPSPNAQPNVIIKVNKGGVSTAGLVGAGLVAGAVTAPLAFGATELAIDHEDQSQQQQGYGNGYGNGGEYTAGTTTPVDNGGIAQP